MYVWWLIDWLIDFTVHVCPIVCGGWGWSENNSQELVSLPSHGSQGSVSGHPGSRHPYPLSCLSPAWSLFCFTLKQGLPGFPVFRGSLELARQTRLTQPCINTPASDFWASGCVCHKAHLEGSCMDLFLLTRMWSCISCIRASVHICVQGHVYTGTWVCRYIYVCWCLCTCMHTCVETRCCSLGTVCLGFDTGSLVDLKLSD